MSHEPKCHRPTHRDHRLPRAAAARRVSPWDAARPHLPWILALMLWAAAAEPVTAAGGSAGAGDLPAEPTPSISVAPDTWGQWRGPNRDGKVPTDEPWPADFKGLTQVWQSGPLGPSYSGPIVGKDKIFTTETRNKKFEVVSAYDRAGGELLWTRQWEGAIKVPFFAARNGSWIRSTPAYDGETLFVGGIREVLVALDANTGAERWKIDFPALADEKNPPFGFVCSPLLKGDHLYLEAAGSLYKIHKKDGSVVWRTEQLSGGSMASEGTFSSPVFATLAGQEQLVVQSRQELLGIRPADGTVLWRHGVPSFRGMNILTPTVWQSSVFTSTYRNASFRFDVADHPEQGLKATELWQNNAQAYMSSPIEIDGVAYMHLGNGRLTAVDLNSGERLWTSKPFGPYWSMVAQGQRILALDSQGELLLLSVDRDDFKVLDRRQISDRETWAHLATAGDQLAIRDLNGLTLWQWRDAPATARPAEPEASP